MREFIWNIIAWAVTRQRVTNWLIRRSQRTPYHHITSTNGQDTYMRRWWLFNPYGRNANNETTPPRWRWLPSIRVHHIMRPDNDRHLHDHPWNARTIVLRGWYKEERKMNSLAPPPNYIELAGDGFRDVYRRHVGYTGCLLFGQYHRISAVSPGGVWTLFFTWGKRGTWGFDVDGVKVPWREYLHPNIRVTKQYIEIDTSMSAAPDPEYTNWFPPKVKPAYVGFYQRKYIGFDTDSDLRIPDYWDGKSWVMCHGDERPPTEKHYCQALFPWRGLASPPPTHDPFAFAA